MAGSEDDMELDSQKQSDVEEEEDEEKDSNEEDEEKDSMDQDEDGNFVDSDAEKGDLNKQTSQKSILKGYQSPDKNKTMSFADGNLS